ncbi:uncharacterized protein LOC128304033 [Anopheles moucheti]|uniref:uncharacterized protein LOC128304033 n=1 Tax=Anopheles moucheti TaxID=186751 RepID=UPI0022F01F9B|nr:uncharacterized protein LOC128304033 [Anopheles moucheti]
MDQIKVTTNFTNSCFYDENKKIRFDPPVYEQRYWTILRLLELDCWKTSFKKIVEFGCAEMKFFRLLRTLPAVEKILEVDIDENILHQSRHLVRPMLSDYLSPPAKPLTVEVWRGNIAEPYECLEGTDVVVGIEIIEHLHQPVLDKVPENVFGFIKPKVAFFSTPNAEYNVLFDGLYENGFRHLDHKFEWTRGQFEQWGESICQRYPDYCVKYFGIGPAPAGTETVGCVSQMAVFVRHDFLASFPPVAASVTTEEENVPVSNESAEVEQRTPNAQIGEPARPNSQFIEVNGEILLIQPPTDDAILEVAGRVPAVGDAAVENVLCGADDVDAEERYREYNEILDDIDDSDGDFDDEDDIMYDMYVPEEVARTLRTRNDSGNFEEEDVAEASREYWMVVSEVYPVAEPDNRSREQHIQDAAEYQLRRLRNFGDDFLAPEQDHYLIPLQTIHDCMDVELATIGEVRQSLLRAGYRIGEDDTVNLPLEDEEENDSDEERLFDDGGELDDDDRYPAWDDNEEAKASRGVVAMTLEDCDETWD